MLIFVYSRKRFVGSLSWFLFGLAWLFNVPHFLSLKDYYKIQVFVETTSFSALSIAVYFLFAFTSLKYALIVEVAKQSALIGRSFGFNMIAVGRSIYLNGKHVTLILASYRRFWQRLPFF